MEEAFLHFIWEFQQFKSRDLKTDTDQKISVHHPGYSNTNAGPDFKNAKIEIGEIIWNGDVEIHVHAQDWNRHKHQNDASYDSVILHVVWENDASIQRNDNTIIPAFEIKNLVDRQLILKYHQLLQPEADILCQKFLSKVKPITILSTMDKALAQRLEARSEKIFRAIALTGNDWEQITWRRLCDAFGFKTNSFAFTELAKSLPVKILRKEAQSQKTVEALLFGQAGFLDEELDDAYFQELKKEYDFKRKKYQLERRLDKHQWKFLRLRPANFPTIRIAQLAAFVASHPNLFSFFINYATIPELKKDMKVVQSDYWFHHYNFGLQTDSEPGKLGVKSIENILINAVAPILFAYGIHKDQESLKEKSIQLLLSVSSEKNSITKKWSETGLKIKSAFDSQALIEIYNKYCLKKRCLECPIGIEIIKDS